MNAAIKSKHALFIVLLWWSVGNTAADAPADVKARDEACITAIRDDLSVLRKLSSAQLRTAFAKIARSQVQGKPATVSSTADQAVVYLLTAIQQCDFQQAEVACVLDSLPAAAPAQRVFIAADVINSAHLMPHFITQLLLTTVTLNAQTTFLSIYESGSTDATGAVLRQSCMHAVNMVLARGESHRLHVLQVIGCACWQACWPCWRSPATSLPVRGPVM